MMEEHRLHQRGMRIILEDEVESSTFYSEDGSYFSDDAAASQATSPAYTGQISLLVALLIMSSYMAVMGGEFAVGRQQAVVQSKAKTVNADVATLWMEGPSKISASGKKLGNKHPREKRVHQQQKQQAGSSVSSRPENEEEDSAPTAPIKIPSRPKVHHHTGHDDQQVDPFPGREMERNLPPVWDSFRSVTETNHSDADIPVFFHLPKSGGSTVKDILLNCHFKVMASEVGILDSHDQDSELRLIHVEGQSDLATHVNVDVTTKYGLVRARTMGLVKSGLVEVIATPLLSESAAILFQDEIVKGRVFALFRHPIRRAVSMFAYLRKAHWEPTYRPEFERWTLEHYALSDVVEDNFMVRQLAQVPDEEGVNEAHLELAKAIISQKVLVGILDRVEDSLIRFEQFFGWRYTKNPTRQETCRNTLLVTGVNTNTDSHNKMPEVASNAFQMLQQKNRLDLLLFSHVERLFDYQAKFVENIPQDVRLLNATCSLCEMQGDTRR